MAGKRIGGFIFFVSVIFVLIIINFGIFIYDVLKFIHKLFLAPIPKNKEAGPVYIRAPKTGLEKLYETYLTEFSDKIKNEPVYSVIEIPWPLVFSKHGERVTICAVDNSPEEILEAFKKPLGANYRFLKDYPIYFMDQDYVDDLLLPIINLGELVKFLSDNPMKIQRAFQQKPAGYTGEIYVKFTEEEIQDIRNKQGHGMLPYMSDPNYGKKRGPINSNIGLPIKKKRNHFFTLKRRPHGEF
jgi:hypothetical protein